MKRRKFLKAILGAAAAVVVPFRVGSGDDVVERWIRRPRKLNPSLYQQQVSKALNAMSKAGGILPNDYAIYREKI